MKYICAVSITYPIANEMPKVTEKQMPGQRGPCLQLYLSTIHWYQMVRYSKANQFNDLYAIRESEEGEILGRQN